VTRPLQHLLAAFGAGTLFGIGLIVSGMTQPSKVQGFLDLIGPWDPSLALVMGGAMAVATVAFRLAGQRPRTLLGEPMHLPGARGLTPRLVLGSLAFGVGWGLAGYCPGPALVSVPGGSDDVLIFVGAMAAGMVLYEIVERRGGSI
jgi:uncharacterized membrane protein YedE/YeeE